MTEALIARQARYLAGDGSGTSSVEVYREWLGKVADALEAQAKRITELEENFEEYFDALAEMTLDKRAAEAERDALAAQVAEALASLGPTDFGGHRVVEKARRILSAPASDALNRVRAEALRDYANVYHQVSEEGNMFGGYNCECGLPWLTTLGGCLEGATIRTEAHRIEKGES